MFSGGSRPAITLIGTHELKASPAVHATGRPLTRLKEDRSLSRILAADFPSAGAGSSLPTCEPDFPIGTPRTRPTGRCGWRRSGRRLGGSGGEGCATTAGKLGAGG